MIIILGFASLWASTSTRNLKILSKLSSTRANFCFYLRFIWNICYTYSAIMSESELKKSKISMATVKSAMSANKSVIGFGARSMSRMKVRRPSFGFTGVPGIKPVERTSQVRNDWWLVDRLPRRCNNVLLTHILAVNHNSHRLKDRT